MDPRILHYFILSLLSSFKQVSGRQASSKLGDEKTSKSKEEGIVRRVSGIVLKSFSSKSSNSAGSVSTKEKSESSSSTRTSSGSVKATSSLSAIGKAARRVSNIFIGDKKSSSKIISA